MNVRKYYYLPVGEDNPPENVWKNNRELVSGCQNSSFLFSGKISPDGLRDSFYELLEEGEYFSSAEFFSNGAMNVFIRNNEISERPIGILIVRQ